MKAQLKTNVTTEVHGRGRPEKEIFFPKAAQRGKPFTVQEIASLGRNKNVSPVTVRKHLNEMTQRGDAVARAVPAGRGHPVHLFALVA